MTVALALVEHKNWEHNHVQIPYGWGYARLVTATHVLATNNHKDGISPHEVAQPLLAPRVALAHNFQEILSVDQDLYEFTGNDIMRLISENKQLRKLLEEKT